MRIHELGHAVLWVSNLKRSANFYTTVLGFREIARGPRMAAYSSGRTHHELLLIEIGGDPPESRNVRPGLYHLGFKIGDTPASINAAYHELLRAGVTIVGASDHGVTHSIYILDPDGNELELYADVTDAWKKDPTMILAPPKPLSLK